MFLAASPECCQQNGILGGLINAQTLANVSAEAHFETGVAMLALCEGTLVRNASLAWVLC